MKNLKLCLIYGFINLLMHNVYAQKGYIATDSSMTSGINIIDGSPQDNAQYIWVQRKNQKKIRYTPDQIIEYGLNNGTIYVSKGISVSGQAKKVFLERVEQGNINLFYYTEKGVKTYFIEKDSTVFIELPKDKDFRKILIRNASDFDRITDHVQVVKYNRKSLSKLISLYNQNSNRHLPFSRFGIIAGYRSTSLTVPPNMPIQSYSNITYTSSSSISFGVFADLPIEMSYFSFNVGFNFSKSGFSGNFSSPKSNTDVVVNLTSVSLPILLRYTFPSFVWRPFVNIGGIYSYNLKSNSKIYESIFSQNTIVINEVKLDEPIISNNMYGYSAGIGLQRNINYRKIASVELRYNQLYGNENTLQKNQVDILFSLSF